ncbi:MAG TPA: hypothetical protein VMZ28_19145 [Kofleriaceae bacterium]|nr:hypothetical protein [Kofleriaceae bacterium]
MRATLVLTAAAALGGCADQAPQESWSVPYVHTVVPWAPDADGVWYLVDTGSPRTQVMPEVAGRASAYAGEVEVPGFDLAGLYDGAPLLVSASLPARLQAALAAGEITAFGGVLGSDLLATVPFALDRDGGQILFGAAASALADGGADVPVELLGGGRACLDDGLCYDADASRLIAPVELDGAPLEALVDTASTFVTIPVAVMLRLLDHDPGLRMAVVDLEGETVGITRLPVRWGGVERTVAVLVVDGLGPSLSRLHVETGRRVEMLIGHSLLEQFAVAIDHAGPSVSLVERAGFVAAPATIGVGLLVRDDGTCFQPISVVRNAPAAAAGVALDSCVVAIDGVAAGAAGAGDAASRLGHLAAGDRVALSWRPGGGEATASAELVAEDWLAP